MLDFIALDFEIANHNFNSACSMGIVYVKDNKIIDQNYFLIKPPQNQFHSKMSDIHGLTESDVLNAPTFDEVWNEISNDFNPATYIIAHNVRFDMNVLKNCLLTYNLEIPNFPYVCSIPISTRACRGEGVPQSLEARTKRFGIKMDEHHNALSDAKAVAELVTTCIKLQRRKNIYTYLSTYSSIAVRQFQDFKHSTHFQNRNSHFQRVRLSDIIPETTNFDPSHPLYKKKIAFTGQLNTLDRQEAMQKAVNVGAILRSTVGKTTDVLVVGTQNKQFVGESGRSSKERKAEELIQAGFNINVVNEEEFIQLLNGV